MEPSFSLQPNGRYELISVLNGGSTIVPKIFKVETGKMTDVYEIRQGDVFTYVRDVEMGNRPPQLGTIVVTGKINGTTVAIKHSELGFVPITVT